MLADVHKRLTNRDNSSFACSDAFAGVRFRALEANKFVGLNVGLAPKTQHVAPGFDRLYAKRDRLLAKKLKSNDPDLPLKPKGMRRSTNERHLEKLEYLHMAMDVAILQRFGMTAEAILKNAGNLDRKTSI